MTTITIKDDFDLAKIADSGQCFRVVRIQDELYRFITGDNILYVRQIADETYEISCSESDFYENWSEYFDFSRDYKGIRESVPESDTYMHNAAECGRGIRILRQEPWEMLISFIISQRKSIPAIRTSIEMICERFGRAVTTEYETVYTFPTAEEIMRCKVTGENGCGSDKPQDKGRADSCGCETLLAECKLGYRLKYIIETVKAVYYREIDLEALEGLGSEQLLDELKRLYGVGEKVANCIALFAYGRVELAPVDTWIRKVIDGIYEGVNPFPGYGDVAGIMQQYIFYYAQTHKAEF